MLKGKKIVVGVTGSIAAYKIPFLVRLLVKEGAEVKVIMTPAAVDFVTPLTLATLSRNDVIFHPFNKDTGTWNSHVELGSWADLMLFAPVSASTLGKMAGGVADNFLVTAYLSAKCPVMVAPAMDLDMFNHPSTQKNIATLRTYGNLIIEPQTGELASGLSGPGRLEEPERILAIIRDFFLRRIELKGKKVLITAGPTFENIDPVRFIGNRSSGRMGFALAEEAGRRGAEVTLIAGPVHIGQVNPSIRRVDVGSAGEMFKACLKHAPVMDIIIMSAAVADYAPVSQSTSKIKKQPGSLTLKLLQTKDILLEISKKKRKGQIFVGFALETENAGKNALKKLKEKDLDMVVLNSLRDKGAGFDYSTNKVTLYLRNGKVIKGELKEKEEVACDIFNALTLLPKRTTQ